MNRKCLRNRHYHTLVQRNRVCNASSPNRSCQRLPRTQNRCSTRPPSTRPPPFARPGSLSLCTYEYSLRLPTSVSCTNSPTFYSLRPALNKQFGASIGLPGIWRAYSWRPVQIFGRRRARHGSPDRVAPHHSPLRRLRRGQGPEDSGPALAGLLTG